MFRFGVTLTTRPTSHQEFALRAAWVEKLGLDILAVPDRRASMSPVAALVGAAKYTKRLVLRGYVFDASRWEPSLLAREIHSAQLLTDGRVEAGLGAGHAEPDDVAAAAVDRVAKLENTATELRGQLGELDPFPKILIAGMAKTSLRVAAEHADIVSFGAVRPLSRADSPGHRLATSGETAELVKRVREWAGGRDYETDALVPAVVVDKDPDSVARRIADNDPHVTAEQAMDCPFLLLAKSPEHAAEQLIQRRERYGFSSFVTDERNAKALSKVAAELRGE